jgi:hypothetical protein
VVISLARTEKRFATGAVASAQLQSEPQCVQCVSIPATSCCEASQSSSASMTLENADANQPAAFRPPTRPLALVEWPVSFESVKTVRFHLARAIEIALSLVRIAGSGFRYVVPSQKLFYVADGEDVLACVSGIR